MAFSCTIVYIFLNKTLMMSYVFCSFSFQRSSVYRFRCTRQWNHDCCSECLTVLYFLNLFFKFIYLSTQLVIIISFRIKFLILCYICGFFWSHRILYLQIIRATIQKWKIMTWHNSYNSNYSYHVQFVYCAQRNQEYASLTWNVSYIVPMNWLCNPKVGKVWYTII